MATGNEEPALPPDMVRALTRSGYLMESRINRVIRERGWLVNANNYIPDPATGIPRESDLVAERWHNLVDGQFHAFVNVASFECINNDSPVVFLSRVPEDPQRASQHFCMGGLPRTIEIPQGRDPDANNSVSIASVIAQDGFHRFFTLPAYDIYCTFTPRSQSQRKEKGYWVAEQPKDYYGSFCKVIHVREYFQDIHEDRLVSDALHGDGKPLIRVVHYHQVMVFKGPLVVVDQPDAVVEDDIAAEAFQRASHVLYRRSEGDGRGVSSTLIDVITEDYLPVFLSVLEKEAEHCRLILADKIDQLIPRIVPDANLASYFQYRRKHGDGNDSR